MSSVFGTRGIVLSINDLTLSEWPELAASNHLTTLALHPWPQNTLWKMVDFINSDAGCEFLEKCHRLGLQVEYEIHALPYLIRRSLFDANPELFRMDKEGKRNPDMNLCPSSQEALDMVAANAVDLCAKLKSTTGRYFLWGSDSTESWCSCPRCRDLSDSEQALIVENHMISAIRRIDPNASLAHLAYHGTLAAPRAVKPADGVFLEFAPIQRDLKAPFEAQTNGKDTLEHLDANLEVFDPETAQVLDYWLDASLASDYERPAKKLFWSDEVFAADLDSYGGRGVRHITSFGCFIDKDYVEQLGYPPLAEYGRMLRDWRPRA